MPIITKPASIEKNSPAEISLDKSALAAVASVAASTYYSDSSNWKEVFIYYKSSVGNQREILKFNATVASPVATFLVSEKARDIFQVQKIVIVDFDNGSITVPRSQLTVAEFDVDMTPVPAGNAIVWTNPSADVYNIEADGGLTVGPNRGSAETLQIFAEAQIFTGDFEVVFNTGSGSLGDNSYFAVVDEDTTGAPENIFFTGFTGVISGNGGSTLDIKANSVQVASYSGGSNLEIKIQRISSVYSIFINNVLQFSGSAQFNGVGNMKPMCSLRPDGLGTLISSNFVG